MKKLWIVFTLLAVLLLAFAGMAGAEEPTISLNTPTTVEITIPGDVAIYKFTPAEDGMYRFYSTSIDEDNWYDTYGYLLDEDMQLITSNVNGGGDGQFQIVRQLNADKTYYFGAALFETRLTGSYLIKVEKIEGIYATAKRSRVYAEQNQPGTAEVESFSSNGELSYQWYDGETAITDATGKAYTFPALTEAKTYRCVITDTANQTAEVTVDARISSGLTVSGSGGGLVENGNATLSITATARYGADQITYAWYESKLDENDIWYEDLFEGVTGPTLELSGITHNRSFFCRVSDINGDNREYWFNVYLPGKVTFTASSDAETTVAAGAGLTLSATAVSEYDYPVSYKWYREVMNDFGIDWQPIDGANSSTCTIEHVYTRSTFICEATNSVGNTSYKYFTVNVSSSFTPEADGESTVSITPAEPAATLKVKVSNNVGDVAYQWFYYNNTFERYIPIKGAKTSSFPVSASSKAGKYYCLVTDATGESDKVQFEVTIVNHFSAVAEGDADVVLDAGEMAALKVRITKDGGNVFYRWYKREYNTQYNSYEQRELIEDERTDTLTISARNRCEYYCVVSDQYGNTASIQFNVRIRNGFSVNLLQSNYVVDNGEGLTISATGTCTNGVVTYRWQRYEENYGYYNIKESTDSFLTIDAVGLGNIGEYMLYAYDQYGNSSSFWFRVSIENHLSVSAIGDSQRSVDPGADATLAVEANCDTGNLSYQWHQQVWRSDDPNNWYYAPMESETQSTLQLTNIQESKYYLCWVTDEFGGEKSVTFRIKISNGFSAYAENSLVYAEPNASATMKVIASCKSGDLSYQWYELVQHVGEDGSTYGDYEIITGATGATYTINEANRAGEYFCRVKDKYGNTAEAWFNLRINNGFFAWARNYFITVAPGGTATMEVDAMNNTGVLSYQWYRYIYYEDENGGSYGNEQLIEGATEASYTVSDVNKARNYYCRVKDDYGNTETVEFYIRIENNLRAEALNNQNTIAPGEASVMRVAASCTTGEENLRYQWYKRVWVVDDEMGYEYPDDTIIAGAKNDSYTITGGNVGREEYYCRVKDVYDNETAAWFYIYVDNEFEYQALTGVEYGSRIWNVIVNPGATAELAVNASCKVGGLTYQWYEEIQYEENGVLKTREEIIANATGDRYTTGAINERKTYCCAIADEYGDEIQLIFIVSIDNGFYAYAQPGESIYVHPGETAVLKAEADCNDGELTYQWYQDLSYYDESGEWCEDYVSVDNNTDTYTTGAIDEPSHYVCRVSDMYGNREDIRFDIYIDSGLMASAEGSNEVWVAENETATLTVTASSLYETSISYRWEGYDNSTNTLVTAPVTGNREYTCYVTDNYGNTVTVQFHVGVDRMGNLSSTPITEGQPATAVLGEGSDFYHYFVFTPTKTGYYRFYSQADEQITAGCIYNPGFETLAEYHYNGTDNNFLIEYKFNAGQTYYLAARYYNSEITGSFPVLVEMIEGLWVVYADTDEIHTDSNGSATLHVLTEQNSNAELTYTWKKMPSGEIIDQADGDTLTIDSVTQYGEYMCTVSDQYGRQCNARFRVYVNNPGLTIRYGETQTPEVAIGEETTLQIIASGNGSDEVQYQWYNGRIDDVNLLEGETKATLKVTHRSSNSEYYCCAVTDQYGNPYAFEFWVYTVNGFYANTDYNETQVNAGESTTLYVYAGCRNGSIHYQWYENEISEETKLVGQQNNSLTLENVQSRKTYYCRVSDEYGNVADVSTLVKVWKQNELTARSKNDQYSFTVNLGETTTMEVEASCNEGDLYYQWYEIITYEENGEMYSNNVAIANATGTSYTTEAITGRKDYFCRIEDDYCNSRDVWFNIYPENHLTASAKDDQNDFTIEPGESVNLIVEAGCDAGDLSYQWYREFLQGNGINGYNWNQGMIEDAIGDTYTAGTRSENYYCRVTDQYGSSVDVWFHVNVDNQLTASQQNNQSDYYVEPGQTTDLTVVASCASGGLSYEWYRYFRQEDGNGGYNWTWERVEEAIGASWTTEKIYSDEDHYCQVTDEYGNYQDVWFNVYLDNGLTASALNDQSTYYVEPGETVTLTVEASCKVGELSYQWYQHNRHEDEYGNYSWSLDIIDGATEATYTTDEMNRHAEFKCEVLDEYGNSTGVWFYVNLENELTGSAEGDDRIWVEKGDTATLTVTASCKYGNISYRWDGYDNTSNKLVTEPVYGQTEYRCYVTDEYGNTVTVYFYVGVDQTADISNTITAGQTLTVNIEEAGEYNYFVFIPEETDYYSFYSEAENEDTYGYIYNPGLEEVKHDDDSGTGGNFLIVHEFIAGQKYILGARYYDSNITGSFPVRLEILEGLGNAYADVSDIYTDYNESATLRVLTEQSNADLTYTWRKLPSGEIIEQAGGDTLTIDPVTYCGEYECTVSDQYGKQIPVWFRVHVNNPGLIIEQEGTQYRYVTVGETTTLQINVSGDGSDAVQYQWYGEQSGEIEGETEATMTVTHRNCYQEWYYCEVTDQYGNKNNYWFYLNSINGFYAWRDTDELQVGAGESTTLNVYADYSEGDIHYQWYENEISEETMLEDEQSSSLTLVNVQSRNTYYCRVTDDYGNVVDLSILVKVWKENQLIASALDDQSTYYVEPEETVTMTVVASCTEGELSYEWHRYIRQDDGNGAWETIEGATEASYTTDGIYGREEYYCRVSDEYDNIADVSFYVYLYNGLRAYRVGESPRYVEPGTELTLEVDASCYTGGITYQWYRYTYDFADQCWTDGTAIEGATEATLTVVINESAQYYCGVYDEYGNSSGNSYEIMIDNELNLSALNGLSSITVPYGEQATLQTVVSYKLDDTQLRYQWYDEWGNEIPEATDSSYTTDAVTESRQYQCRVHDQYGNHGYTYFYLYFDSGLTAEPEGAYLFHTSDVPITLAVSASTLMPDASITYDWGNEYYGWLSSTSENTYILMDPTACRYYCDVSDGYQSKRVWFYVVDEAVVYSGSDTNWYVTPNEEITLKVVAWNAEGDITYQWFEDNGTGEYTEINGATEANYTFIAVRNNNVYCRIEGTGIQENMWFQIYIQNNFQSDWSDTSRINVIPTGGSVQLTVNMSSRLDDDLSYQWFRNGEEISGATSNTLSVATAGEYQVRASDRFGNNNYGETIWCIDDQPETVSEGQKVNGTDTGRIIYQFVPNSTGFYQIDVDGSCDIYRANAMWTFMNVYDGTQTTKLEAGKTYYAVLSGANSNFKYTLLKEEQTEYYITLQPGQNLRIPSMFINYGYSNVNYSRSDDRRVVDVDNSHLYIRKTGTANVTVRYENGHEKVYRITVASGNTLILPNQLQEIEEDAFNGDTSVRFIKLGSNVQTVRSGAFANMGSITVIVDNYYTEFENGVFSNSNPLVICSEDSNVAYYCIDHVIPYLINN